MIYVDSDERQVQRAEIEDAICDAVIDWIEQRVGTLPSLFRQAFRNGIDVSDHQVEPWVDTFRNVVSDAIKENPRFQNIVLAELLAGTHEMIKELVNQFENFDDKLSFLTTIVDSVEWDRALMFNSSSAEIRLEDKARNIAEPSGLDRPKIKIGRKFKLILQISNSPATGFGLQESKGRWFPILLDAQRNRLASIDQSGTFDFPPNDWLEEKDPMDTGKRRMAVVVTTAQLPDDIKKALTVSDSFEKSVLSRISQFVNHNGEEVSLWYTEFDVEQ